MKLPVGESTTVAVVAKEFWSHTGIDVRRGEQYAFRADGEWTDWTVRTTPRGFSTAESPIYARLIHAMFERKRRMPDENWFALIGAVGENISNAFRIGAQLGSWSAGSDGELLCFANDYGRAYWNNKGSIRLNVTRLA